jgi:hypothetical protein
MERVGERVPLVSESVEGREWRLLQRLLVVCTGRVRWKLWWMTDEPSSLKDPAFTLVDHVEPRTLDPSSTKAIECE